MKTHESLPNRQSGVMLLEALISILIFSIGILAIIGLLAASVKNAGDAKYRSDASLLTTELFAEMETSNRTQATLQTNFQTGGAGYNTWLPYVYTRLPGVSGVPANQPVVTIVPNNATATPSSQVTITLYWNAPSEAPQAHQFVAVADVI